MEKSSLATQHQGTLAGVTAGDRECAALTAPSDVLTEWIDRIPVGRALDLGAGDGAVSRWLAACGFDVDAVERDPAAYARLKASLPGIRTHNLDLKDFNPPVETYSLVVASAVLHFLRPTDLWPLADRLEASLVPGGVLIAEVFTTDDPGLGELREAGAAEIEPNTFIAPDPIGLIHYFDPGELQRVFGGLETLAYDANRRADPDSEWGYRAGGVLVARRPEFPPGRRRAR